MEGNERTAARPSGQTAKSAEFAGAEFDHVSISDPVARHAAEQGSEPSPDVNALIEFDHVSIPQKLPHRTVAHDSQRQPELASAAESNQVSILKPLRELKPSPKNDDLYRPVSSTDPEIEKLADSIRAHGLREPLVITRDGYLISGHRRFVACRLAGLTEVPCRVEPIWHADPEFLTLLREYNRQRVKGIDEIVREEIVTTNPEEAHRCLVAHRRKQAKLVAPSAICIEGEKHRAAISLAKQPFLQAALKVIKSRSDYWPLSVRQVHYGLLNDPPLKHSGKSDSIYTNDMASYKNLCDLLTRARLTGALAWNAIADETRPVETWSVDANVSPFVARETEQFLKGYYRDLLQSQPNHIEIIGEKNTILNIIRPVAMEYCAPLTIGRGYSSLPPRREIYLRYKRSGQSKLVLLVLSDFDPEGEDIAHSFARSMRDDFHIKKVTAIKVALTVDQVRELELPPIMKAKAGSSRKKKFTDRYGDEVHELEAVPPEQLQQFLRNAMDQVLDVKAFNAEIDREKQEAAYLEGVRKSIQEQCLRHLPAVDSN